MSIYIRLMTRASKFLFIVALIVLGLEIAGTFAFALTERSQGFDPLSAFIFGIGDGLESAFWPFFGSALLWVMDRKLPSAEAAE